MDVYADRTDDVVGGVRVVELRRVRSDKSSTHGAGCTLSAAVAAELAKQASCSDCPLTSATHCDPSRPDPFTRRCHMPPLTDSSQAHGVQTLDSLAAVHAAHKYLSQVLSVSSGLSIGAGTNVALNHAQAPWLARKGSQQTIASRGGAPKPRLSTIFWSDRIVAELANEALNGRFVTALHNGSLPRDALTGYIAQGKFFLEAFGRVYVLVRLAFRCALVLLPSFINRLVRLALHRRRWQSCRTMRSQASRPWRASQRRRQTTSRCTRSMHNSWASTCDRCVPYPSAKLTWTWFSRWRAAMLTTLQRASRSSHHTRAYTHSLAVSSAAGNSSRQPQACIKNGSTQRWMLGPMRWPVLWKRYWIPMLPSIRHALPELFSPFCSPCASHCEPDIDTRPVRRSGLHAAGPVH